MLPKYRDLYRNFKSEGFTTENVSKALSMHSTDAARMQKLYGRYTGDQEAVSIFHRPDPAPFSFDSSPRLARLDQYIRNSLANNWDAEIADTKVGYLFGNPISYSLDDTKANKHEKKQKAEIKDRLSDFLLRNNAEDKDAEAGLLATVCGYSGRLMYIAADGKGLERYTNVEPWNCIFFPSVEDPEFSIYYYDTEKGRTVECYDDTTIHIFSTENHGVLQKVSEQAHMFACNPLFGFANNRDLRGDAENVISLIDAYDRTISDVASEIEQYRLAYLVARGVALDPEDMERVNQNGIFELFGKDDSLSYLTKDVNDGMIEHFLDRLEKNIIRFAKSVDFTDEAFGTQISGVAMRFKLLSLENKSITMERKFTAGLRHQMRALFSVWQLRHRYDVEEYLNVFFNYSRNVPVNKAEEADLTLALRGNVSEETRLAQLSFVDDVQFEMDKMEEQRDDVDVLGYKATPHLRLDLDEELEDEADLKDVDDN